VVAGNFDVASSEADEQQGMVLEEAPHPNAVSSLRASTGPIPLTKPHLLALFSDLSRGWDDLARAGVLDLGEDPDFIEKLEHPVSIILKENLTHNLKHANLKILKSNPLSATSEPEYYSIPVHRLAHSEDFLLQTMVQAADRDHVARMVRLVRALLFGNLEERASCFAVRLLAFSTLSLQQIDTELRRNGVTSGLQRHPFSWRAYFNVKPKNSIFKFPSYP
jgi:hypothetical protein